MDSIANILNYFWHQTIKRYKKTVSRNIFTKWCNISGTDPKIRFLQVQIPTSWHASVNCRPFATVKFNLYEKEEEYNVNCKKFRLFVMISWNTRVKIFPTIKFNFHLILSENSCRLGRGSRLTFWKVLRLVYSPKQRPLGGLKYSTLKFMRSTCGKSSFSAKNVQYYF